MRITILATAVLVVGAVIGYTVQVNERERLKAHLASARESGRLLDALKQKNQSLQSLQPSAEELAALEEARRERARLLLEIERRASCVPEGLRPGDWLPHEKWQHRGTKTPHTAVESALWSAAGGDVKALAALLELEPDSRLRIEALHQKLPPEIRVQFPTPEVLLASLTIPKIPRTQAQLVWEHVSDDDHASIGLMLEPEASDALPVAGQPRPKRRVVTLSLHRTDAGWRLVLPPEAVDRMAASLSASLAGAGN